jgi:hypothetical protein
MHAARITGSPRIAWIARLLLVLPLWWSASPWHVTDHHLGPAGGGHETPLDGSRPVEPSHLALQDANLFDMNADDTDRSIDCGAGPCIAIVASAPAVEPGKASRTVTSARHLSLGVGASPPPKPPPIHS